MGSFALNELKTKAKGKADAYVSISPSESQERIMDGPKMDARVSVGKGRSGSVSGSDDIIIQGIMVTTDVKVVRE